jgi:hypothetical protein
MRYGLSVARVMCSDSNRTDRDLQAATAPQETTTTSKQGWIVEGLSLLSTSTEKKQKDSRD